MLNVDMLRLLLILLLETKKKKKRIFRRTMEKDSLTITDRHQDNLGLPNTVLDLLSTIKEECAPIPDAFHLAVLSLPAVTLVFTLKPSLTYLLKQSAGS